MDNGNEIGKEREGELFEILADLYGIGERADIENLEKFVENYNGPNYEKSYLRRARHLITLRNHHTRIISLKMYKSLETLFAETEFLAYSPVKVRPTTASEDYFAKRESLRIMICEYLAKIYHQEF